MNPLLQLRELLQTGQASVIARRYVVVNGFDGALTMLGICMGFLLSAETDIEVILAACIGAAIALGVSGFNSAWLSEAAEQRRLMNKLEQAMLRDLQGTHHARVSLWVPLLVALANGLSPLLLSLFILAPILLQITGVVQLAEPLLITVATAFLIIFLLGIYIGFIAGRFWLWSGLRAIAVALITAFCIFLAT